MRRLQKPGCSNYTRYLAIGMLLEQEVRKRDHLLETYNDKGTDK